MGQFAAMMRTSLHTIAGLERIRADVRHAEDVKGANNEKT